jgi:general secretion pathway protein I
MPTLAPGNKVRRADRPSARGFTLIEVMVVLAIIAIGVAVTALALRDPTQNQLERDATRLAALLEMARAEARASGLPVTWVPSNDAQPPAADAPAARFRFVGLSAKTALPSQWLDNRVQAQVPGARGYSAGAAGAVDAGRSTPRSRQQRARCLCRCHARGVTVRRLATRGFTLIEVMVALAIVAVALGAGMRAAGALTDNAQRLADVTAAQWCADNELTVMRLSRRFPDIGESEFSCEQLGRTYRGRLLVRPAGFNPDFRQVHASMSDDGGVFLLTLTTLASRR